MSKLSNQYIDIFTAGNHGDKGTFSEADLDQIVANYQPGHHEAPAVVGHPKSNAPAYGWVEGVRRVGAKLQAKLKQVNPQFEEAVDAGSYKKRSVSLYKGPGGWSLRHVGFLGAQPPEIKGLAEIQFGEEDKESVDIDFEESSMAEQDTDQAFEGRMTAWFKKMFGDKPEVKTFSEADMQSAIEAAVKPLRDQIATHTTNFSEAGKAAASAAAKGKASDAIAKLKRSGKWVPAFDRAHLDVVFDELATTVVTVDFGEGDQKKTLTPLQVFANFMDELPAIVPAVAVVNGAVAAPVSNVPGVNDTQRAPADPNSIAFHNAIRARMDSAKVDYGTAMNQIAQEQPQLTRPGGAAAGAA